MAKWMFLLVLTGSPMVNFQSSGDFNGSVLAEPRSTKDKARLLKLTFGSEGIIGVPKYSCSIIDP